MKTMGKVVIGTAIAAGVQVAAITLTWRRTKWRRCRQPSVLTLRPAVLDRKVLALDELPTFLGET